MTETTHGATILLRPPRPAEGDAAIDRHAHPGQAAYGNEIRIVDDEGRPACPATAKRPGHLQSRGHWIAAAYFRRPEVEAADPGWLDDAPATSR